MAKGAVGAAVNGSGDRNDTVRLLVELLVFGVEKCVQAAIQISRAAVQAATVPGGTRRLG
jgi:hypothetical protein